MGYSNEEHVSPHWAGFRSLWWLIAIILFLLLLIIWFMGCGPGGKYCKVPVAVTPAAIIPPSEVFCGFDPAKAKANIKVEAICTGVGTGGRVNIAGMDCGEEEAGAVICTSSNSENIETNPTITTLDASGEGFDSTGNFTLILEPPVTEPVSVEIPAVQFYFDVDSDQLSNTRMVSLDPIITYLDNHSGATAHLAGFHDPSGNYEYNQDLAKRRAQSVAKQLEEAGISAERIILEKPTETTGTGDLQEARRVEVTIQGD